jgi:hypothetical protein
MAHQSPLMRVIPSALVAVLVTGLAPMASARFIEPSSNSSLTLSWETSSDSLQARLFSALSHLSPAGGVSHPRKGQVQIDDGVNRILCEAGTPGLMQIISYRCDLQLTSPHLDWSSDTTSTQYVLFSALNALKDVDGDRVNTLNRKVQGSSILLRLAAPDSASKIVCQKARPHDSIDSPLAVRCMIDIRP